MPNTMDMSRLGTMVTVAVLFCFGHSFAQESAGRCSSLKGHMTGKTTVADPAEDNYDVKYLKFNITMTNLSTAISGDVTTNAVAVIPAFSAYVFELDSTITIDSVFINGASLPVTSVGDVRTVAISPALPSGTLFIAQVFYHGTPVSGTLFASAGINNLASPSWGTRATFTLSESYHAREWWPCKQSLTDKIDSVDMWITVEDSLKAGSNGMLQAITPIDSNHVRYEWKERFPIDYYLISAAVAPYVDYSYYMHFTGSTDSMLVQNYVYNNPATLPAFQSVIDSTGLMIDYFSTLYGRYPFWQEKYGHCMGPLSGGMEHQTMTTLGYFEGTLVAHELGHQWFGDNATCGTWADIFMNEGFASYTEYLFVDQFRSHAQATATIQGQQSNVKSIAAGTIYVDDTTNENRIFDSRLSYDKGACLLHMLRFIINNDSEFFSVYKTYQAQRKDSTGTIMDFRNATESVLGATINGINIDSFFSQWAYENGYPIYNVNWNQSGSDVYVTLTQTTAVPSSVPLFTIPMELQLQSAAGDTIVRVVNNLSTQTYHFTWDKTMSGIATDPNYWLVYNLNGITHDLSINNLSAPEISIQPNPATSSWNIANLPNASHFTLTDVSGRIRWENSNTSSSSISIPASNLAPGLYLLHITGNDKVAAYKLIKE